MFNCQVCASSRIITVSGKCSDLFSAGHQGKEYDGYVPSNLEIGGGDYMEFDYCLDCGRIQGQFPVATPEWGG